MKNLFIIFFLLLNSILYAYNGNSPLPGNKTNPTYRPLDLSPSTITCNTAYVPGTTMKLYFTIDLLTEDDEYGDSVSITFPLGLTPTGVASDPIVQTDPETDEDLNGVNGQTITWGDNDNTFGGIYPGSQSFYVEVTIDADITGDQVFEYFISGDQYGTPKDASGTATIQQYVPGAVTFNQISTGLDGFEANWFELGDFDNDNDLDIIFSGGIETYDAVNDIYEYIEKTTILLNNGDNTFTEQTNSSFEFHNGSADLGDYNNDGYLDVVLNGTNDLGEHKTLIYKNNGNGTFSEQTNILLEGILGTAKWGDYNNDGLLDILACGPNDLWQSKMIIYENNGDNSFTDVNMTFPDYGCLSGDWVDIDADGDLDVITVDWSGLSVYLNENSLEFIEQNELRISNVNYFTKGDYDNDGDFDLLVNGSDNSGLVFFKVYKIENGVLSELKQLALPEVDAFPHWGDYNNDGKLDILFEGGEDWNYYSKIYKNEGNDRFSEQIVNGLDNSIRYGKFADIDNDGDLDILNFDYSLNIYQNSINEANTTPSAPENLQTTVLGDGVVELKWDKATDTETPQDGLSYNLYISSVSGKDDKLAAHSNISTGYRKIVESGELKTNNYKINDLGLGTYYWSVQAIDHNYAGSPFATEGSFTISILNDIYPVDAQIVELGVDGDILTVNESSVADTRQWKYSTNAGGPYNIISGEVNVSYTPNFSVPDVYFIICESVKDGNIAISNEVKITIPQFTQKLDFPDIEKGSWGDYDDDGDLDIISSNYFEEYDPVLDEYIYGTNYIVYINDGANGFTELIIAQDDWAWPEKINWVNFNNDEYLDVYINFYDRIEIYQNNTNGTFDKITEFGNNIQVVSEAWFDYDLDGDLDCIITGTDIYESPRTEIYTNELDTMINSNLKFRVAQKVEVTDYNNDNYPDILLFGTDINGNKHTTLYKNNGDKSFSEQTDIVFPKFYETACAAWGDYNNDGYSDLVISGSEANKYNIKVYKNTGDNSFIEQTNNNLIPLEDGACDWIDINNDGNLDIFISGDEEIGGNPSTIYINNGNNSFSELKHSNLPDYSYLPPSWGDYDNDGDLDLIYKDEFEIYDPIDDYSYSEDSVYIYNNNQITKNTKPGVPSNLSHQINGFQVTLSWDAANDAETPQQSLSYNVRIGTAPGLSDIVSPSSNTTTGYLKIPGTGNTWLNNQYVINELDTGTYYWSVQTVDNGYMASAFSEEQSFTVHALFSKQEDIVIGDGDNPVFGDYDNDGDLDIIANNFVVIYDDLGNYLSTDTKMKIYKNNGNNSFVEQTDISINSPFKGEESLIDYNNDGNLDIIFLSYENIYDELGDSISSVDVLKIYQNNGDNTFTEEIIDTISSPLALIDYDNDGDLDLFSNELPLEIKNNNGDGTFTEEYETGLPYSANLIKAGDYDNDGDADLILFGSDSHEKPISTIYKNNGDATFTELSNLNFHEFDGSFVAEWADFDADGDLDIIISGNDVLDDKVTNIYRNDGNDVFTDINTDIRKIAYGDIKWGDYNNDGFPDILYSGESGRSITKIYKNNQDQTFTDIGLDTTLNFSGKVVWGDYDNDKDLDIIIKSEKEVYNETYQYWELFYPYQVYRNNTNYPNNKPGIPANLQTALSGFNLEFTWNKATDPENPSGSVYYNLRIGSAPGTMDIKSAHSNLATGYIKKPEMGNVQCSNKWILKNVEPGKTYYWSVQAVDYSYLGGSWAAEQSFTVPNISSNFAADEVCLGTATSFTDESISPEEEITSWEWDFGGGNTSNEQNPQFIFSDFGTHQVTLTVTSASYTHNITKEVVVKPRAVANFSADKVCQGTLTTFTNLSSTEDVNVTAWSWNFGDEQPIVTIQNPQPHAYVNPGNYNVELTIEVENGCNSTFTQDVIVVENPVKSIKETGQPCTGEGYYLSYGDANNPEYTYQWLYNGSVIENATDYIIDPENAGIYQVSITSSCPTTSPEITIEEADFEITAEGTACPNQNFTLSTTNYSEFYYQWYYEGSPITDANTNTILPDKSGKYEVQISGTGCPSSTSAPYNMSYIDELPTPELYVVGPNIYYLASSINNVSNYRWYLNGQLIPDANEYIYVANKNMGTYYVEINDGGQCWFASESKTIPNENTGSGNKIAAEIFSEYNEDVLTVIYPNPSEGLFNILFRNDYMGKITIRARGIESKVLIEEDIEKATLIHSSQVDLSTYGKGVYFIEIEYNDKIDVQKVIIN